MTLSQSPSLSARVPQEITTSAAGSRKMSALQSFGIRKRPEIDIVLDGKDEFIHSYSTFDEIKGFVKIRLEKDTPIDGLNIVFQGQSDTWVEKMTTVAPRTGRATAKHIFLRVQQPISSNPFSEDNIARAGVTYTFPFSFVVPEKILPYVCNHKTNNDVAKSQHLLLPPSMGDEMLSGEGSTLMDDLTPAMAKIVYSIRVGLAHSTLGGRPKDAIFASKGVRILPSRPELPPEILPVCRDDRCQKYQLRKEKTLRKGFLQLGKRSGRFTAETSQPRSLRLPHARQAYKAPAITTAIINLRYDPASLEEEPPQLSNVESKLKAYTFFGAHPFRQLPDPTSYDVWSIMHSMYSTTVDLSSMNLSAVQWTKHDAHGETEDPSRRASVATSTSSRNVAARQMSTSTDTNSAGYGSRHSNMNTSNSQISLSSDDSFSPASSTTTFSSPASPLQTNSHTMLSTQTIISPSMTYNSSLPYYTASIMVPITLPTTSSANNPASVTRNSVSASPLSTAERSGAIAPDVIPSTPTVGTSISSIGRKRATPTFLPTFHSCLISRIYALELSIHGANRTPQINLRTPIQISSELPPRQAASASEEQVLPTAPLSWYDPFDLEQRSSTADNKQDVANDEAIARALASSPRGTGYLAYNQDDGEIPSYAEIQTNTSPFNNSAIASSAFDNFPQRLPRHNSAPLAHDEDDRPPEYHATAGFRRRTTLPATNLQGNNNGDNNNQTEAHSSHTSNATRRNSSAATATTTTTTSTSDPPQNSRRRGSLGWTKKKLGLRS